MPKVRRYFPVSQKINFDPEVRQLKKDLGLKGFSMWLEILSQTDGTGGLWKGSENQIRAILAGICESNTRGAARALNWFTNIGWITWLRQDAEGVCDTKQRGSVGGSATPNRGGLLGGLRHQTEGVCKVTQRGSAQGNRWGLKVRNFANYHGHAEGKENPAGNFKTSPPSEPSEPSEPKEDINKEPQGTSEEKNPESETKTPALLCGAEVWKKYKAWRIECHKPVTLIEEEQLWLKLKDLRAAGHDPKAIVLQSIERHWVTGFWPIRGGVETTTDDGIMSIDDVRRRIADRERNAGGES